MNNDQVPDTLNNLADQTVILTLQHALSMVESCQDIEGAKTKLMAAIALYKARHGGDSNA